MTRSKQRELILEQRHLLGVFFGVVLFGAVVFAGGYVLGHSRGEQQAAAQYASVAAALDKPGAGQQEGDAAKTDPADLSFYERVGQKSPSDEPPPVAPTSRPAARATTPPPPARPAASGAAPALAKPVFLQVGAFTEESQAQKQAGDLRKLGFTARIDPPQADRFYRVLLGPFETAELVSAAERRLEANGIKSLRR